MRTVKSFFYNFQNELLDFVEEAVPSACFGYHVTRAGFRKGWATISVMKNTQIFLDYQQFCILTFE